MLRRIVKLQLACQPPGFGWRKGFVQSRRSMRVEIIHHQADQLGFREIDINQQPHLLCKIPPGSSRGDIDLSPARQRLHKEEEIRRALTLVFIVTARRAARSQRQWRARLTDQLHRAFVKTDLRPPRISWLGVQIQHILHVPDKGRTHAGDTPLFFLPRLEVVFFSTRRTVSSETAATRLSSMSRSASNCIARAITPGRWGATHQRDQKGFLFAVQLWCRALPHSLSECRRQSGLDKALAGPMDSGETET